MKKRMLLIVLFVTVSAAVGFAKEASEKVDETKYLGVWIRQATLVNGSVVGRDPAVLTLKKDSFTSANATCATAGALSVNRNSMTMVMTQSNCPGPTPPFTVNHTYTISPDENTMTIVMGPMQEIYLRELASNLKDLEQITQTPSRMINTQNESKKSIVQNIR
ncbi:MAG: hypothetical protein HY582_03385 [Candidatus Omnitrophica bacterium]|nr:hypothetical protein [Candidatus Omnitrophota bacterium]